MSTWTHRVSRLGSTALLGTLLLSGTVSAEPFTPPLAQLGDWEGAALAVEEALRRTPDVPYYREFLIRYYLTHPKYEERLSRVDLSMQPSLNTGTGKPEYTRVNVSRERAQVHLRALAKLSERGVTAAGDTLQALLAYPHPTVRTETAAVIGSSALPNKTELLLPALNAEETSTGAALIPVLSALGETSSPVAFTRVLRSYVRLRDRSTSAPGIGDDWQADRDAYLRAYLVALHRLPNPAPLEELKAQVRAEEPWRQTLAVAELLRRDSPDPVSNGVLWLLEEVLSPRPFPVSAWAELSSRIPQGNRPAWELIRNALASDDRRVVVRALMLASQAPAEHKPMFNVATIDLLSAGDRLPPAYRASAMNLLSPPDTTSSLEALTRILILEEPTAREQRGNMPDAGKSDQPADRVISALQKVSAEPLRLRFLELVDEATSAGAPAQLSHRTLKRAMQVVSSWPAGPPELVLINAINRLFPRNAQLAYEAAVELRPLPLAEQHYREMMLWLPATISTAEIDSNLPLAAVLYLLKRTADPKPRDLGLEFMRSEEIARNVIGITLLYVATYSDASQVTHEEQELLEKLLARLDGELRRQEAEGLPASKIIKEARDSAQVLLTQLAGTNPRSNWFLR